MLVNTLALFTGLDYWTDFFPLKIIKLYENNNWVAR